MQLPAPPACRAFLCNTKINTWRTAVNSLFNNIKLAHKRMRGDPVAFTDAISGAVGKAERGAHRHKWQAIAMCVGVARQVRKSFSLFEELRSAPCLQDNKKVQKATEKNFKKFVPIAVATRSFHNTEASENRISVYSYCISYFVNKKIPLGHIPNKIKAKKGIDGVYALLKAKKREGRDLQDDSHATAVGNTEQVEATPDKHEPVAPKSARASGERKSATGAVSDEGLMSEAMLETGLILTMPSPDELDRYRDGSTRRGQRRRIEVVYGGTDDRGYHVWEYVYGRDVEANRSSREDNDNEVDYEDEDAA